MAKGEQLAWQDRHGAWDMNNSHVDLTGGRDTVSSHQAAGRDPGTWEDRLSARLMEYTQVHTSNGLTQKGVRAQLKKG